MKLGDYRLLENRLAKKLAIPIRTLKLLQQLDDHGQLRMVDEIWRKKYDAFYTLLTRALSTQTLAVRLPAPKSVDDRKI